MGIVRLLETSLRDRIAARNPEAFARTLGVNLKGQARFYGISRGMFGSEPWMVTLGDNVYITAGVQFVTHDGGTLVLRKFRPDLEWSAPITVGNDVYIGVRSIILPGVSIGDRVVIGAGSVITNSVPAGSVVAGNPARVIRSFDEYLERMKEKSLGFGHLSADAKDQALRAYFGYDGGVARHEFGPTPSSKRILRHNMQFRRR